MRLRIVALVAFAALMAFGQTTDHRSPTKQTPQKKAPKHEPSKKVAGQQAVSAATLAEENKDGAVEKAAKKIAAKQQMNRATRQNSLWKNTITNPQ